MLIGAIVFLLGVVIYFFPNAFSWFGRLPGDIRIKNDFFGREGAFYFPLTTMIIISVVLSVLAYFLRR